MKRTAKLYDFAAERDHRAQDLAALLETSDALECPHCQAETKPFGVDVNKTVSYRCKRGHGWRVDANGDLMRGLKGKRYW
ncbi:hypothetical protein MPL3356_60562 [Mesorhizobium plurifarium]|uniref:Uncharacterized protein n=1 Tax=Mesorhizobium plurifarium TaxID=69974 RepID=A0A090EFS4_MESPL|nr:hypothetical protein MPL3356_60562 [Mesorhizobium plurifarium]